MARLIKITDSKPVKVEIGGEHKWICMCGLSKNKPYCDGAHKQCHDEKEETTYVYENGERKEV